MTASLTVIILDEGTFASDSGSSLSTLREAICLRNIEHALALPMHEARVLLVSNNNHLAALASTLGARVHVPHAKGSSISSVLDLLPQGQAGDPVLVLQGGMLPLLCSEDWDLLDSLLRSNPNAAYTNSFENPTMVGWSPACSLAGNVSPTGDGVFSTHFLNNFPLPVHALPYTPGYQFTLEAMPDALLLQSVLHASDPLLRVVNEVPYRSTNIDIVRDMLTVKGIKLWISGRIHGSTVEYMNTKLNIRIRAIIDQHSAMNNPSLGYMRSFAGQYIEKSGLSQFIRVVEESADCAVLDIEPLCAHFRVAPSAHDLFMSSVGEGESIENSWLQEFTHAIVEARIPIILGGHNLVQGGLLALVDASRYRRRAMSISKEGVECTL